MSSTSTNPTDGTTNPWQDARWHEGLVAVPDTARKLSLTIAGPSRKNPSNGPLVIIAAGLGGVAAEHILVAQYVATFARVLRFDRAGYGASVRGESDPPETFTMASGVRDLVAVLKEVDLPPPYVLVGQSFGGVFIREFLNQRGAEEVKGLVLVDSNPYLRVDVIEHVDEVIGELCGDRTYEDVNGLERNTVLTPAQVEQIGKDAEIAVKNGTIKGEASVADESVRASNEGQGVEVVQRDEKGRAVDIRFNKKVLGKERLSVIIGDFPKDFHIVLKYAEEHGLGSDEVHQKAARILEFSKRTWYGFQQAMQGLTEGESRAVMAAGTGQTHNIQLTRPDLIAEEVKWVVEGSRG